MEEVPDSRALASLSELVESCIADLVERSVEWDVGRLMVQFEDGSSSWALSVRSGGSQAGISPSRRTKKLAKSLSAEIDLPLVARMRVNFLASGEVSVEATDSSVVGSPDWVWPDEEGYAGRVYESPPIERMDSWGFESVSGATGEPADSLMRAGEWLSANVPELAAILNPGSSEEALVDFEDRLGVVLPRSVREAWLVHDGQSGNHGALRYIWLSLEASAEQLRWFGDRPDGGVGMIPILKIDGHVAYVESVASGESDGPVWLWEVRGNRDMRLADSFGEYLAWFAGACAAGEIVVSESGLLNRRDEIYPTVE